MFGRNIIQIICLLIGTSVFAQYDTLWTKTYGGSGDEQAHAIERTHDGGIIILGTTNSFGHGAHDLWLIKTDQNGDSTWTKTIGNGDDDYGRSIQETSDHGFIITGWRQIPGSQNMQDIWLLKTDASGNQEWSKTFGGSESEDAYSVIETADGGFIVSGATMSFGSGAWDLWLIKTNSEGDSTWTSIIGEAGSEIGNSIIETPDGGYTIGGFKYTNDTNVRDAWLLHTDSEGQELWSKTYGGTDYDAGRTTIPTSDGGYIVAGDYFADDTDLWLLRLDSDGDSTWAHTFGGIGNDVGYDLDETNQNGYLIAGYSTSFGAGQEDVYLIETDASGEEVWSQTYGGVGNDIGKAILSYNIATQVIAGYTSSFGNGGTDIWLLGLRKSNVLWNVASYGSDETGDGSSDFPFASIQFGIDASANGDTILVQPGTYYENIDYLQKSITIGSLFLTTDNDEYIGTTIVDGNDLGSVVEMNASSAPQYLVGITIQNGSALTGGGIHAVGAVIRIYSCIIKNNTALGLEGGGGIRLLDCNTIIMDSFIQSNSTSHSGGGLNCEGNQSLSIINSTFSSNASPSFYGGAIYTNNYNVIITNSTFRNNSTGRYGGVIYAVGNSGVSIRNCTIAYNTAGYSSGAVMWGGADVSTTIKNSILHNNSPDNFVGQQQISTSYSNIVPAFSGSGNLSEDPLLEVCVNNNLCLTSASPCIDAGDPTSPLDPDGTRADMGAYYFDQTNDYPQISISPDSLDFSVNTAEGSEQSQTLTISNNGTAPLEVEIAINSAMVTDIDGNMYPTVQIGDQVWTSENLKVTHYRDGSAISLVTDNIAWSNLSTEAYCIYNNNASSEVDTYGALYNWYAVDDSRNIAPAGWHVPTDAEWKELEMALGMSQSEADDTSYRGTNEGSKLAGNAGLWDNGALEDNGDFGSSGINALPSSARSSANGEYVDLGNNVSFWTATETLGERWYRTLYYNRSDVWRYSVGNGKDGFAIRCLKDGDISQTSWLTASPDTITIPAGESAEVTITVNAEGMDLGEYLNVITLISNDPTSSLYEVPITMDVVPIHAGPVWHVSVEGSDETGDGSQETPHATIQFGIDASQSGDTVLVQPGTYIENINFNGKNIVVGSLTMTTGDTSYVSQTIIDGDQSGSVVTFATFEDTSTVLTGFTLTNGSGTAIFILKGGGIYCRDSSPRLSNLIIRNNTALVGAGIYARNSDLLISKSIIRENLAGDEGGGLYAGDLEISITESIFDSNEAITTGGGLYFEGVSTVDLAEVRITNNLSDTGGGLRLNASSTNIRIVKCLIDNNYTAESGSGIYQSTGSLSLINSTLADNVITGAGTVGGLYHTAGFLNIQNSILWGNSGQSLYGTATLDVGYSCIEDGGALSGQGNIDSNPIFVDPLSGDFHLTGTSPCIDSGNPDLDGDGYYWAVDLDDRDSDGTRHDIGFHSFEQVDQNPSDNSLAFDGIDDFVSVPYEYSPETIGQARTIAAWVRPEDLSPRASSSVGEIAYAVALTQQISASYSGAHWGGIGIELSEDPKFQAIGYDGQVPYTAAVGSTTPIVGIWSHLALVFNGSTLKLFVNGIEEGSQPFTGFSPTSIGGNAALVIGNHLANQEFNYSFPGFVDGVKLWNRALLPYELRNLVSSAPSISLTDSLIGDWRLDEGDGNIIFDQSESVYSTDGTISGGIWSKLNAGSIDYRWRHFISTTGSNETGDGSEAFPYATIQFGIEASLDGDTVIVQPGTYFENINFNGKNIVVSSLEIVTNDTSYISSTIIDGNQTARVATFTTAEDSTAVLNGLTVYNGNNNSVSDPDIKGGGIYCEDASPTLSKLRIIGNTAHFGGGLYLDNSNSRLINLEIVSNTADTDGGGLYLSNCTNVRIENSSINNNTANMDGSGGNGFGGGVKSWQSGGIFNEVVISHNEALSKGGGLYLDDSNLSLINMIINGNSTANDGGGIYLTDNLISVITNVEIASNTAGSGGGLYSNNARITIDNCVILSNEATDLGGGICSQNNTELTVLNSSIVENISLDGSGGGMLTSISSGSLSNCIVRGNSAFSSGGGLLMQSSTEPWVLDNVLIASNTTQGIGAGYWHNGGSSILTNCTIANNTATENAGGYIGVYGANTIFENCILANNVPQQVYLYPDGESSIATFSYTDIEGGQDGIITNDNGTVNWLSGNLNSDPLFINPLASDFHLQNSSPCIDAGNPDLNDNGSNWETDPDDQDPDGSRMDMGAYYFDQSNTMIDQSRLLLFGMGQQIGNNNAAYSYDTNTDEWSELSSFSDATVQFHENAMAYDLESDRIILFGMGQQIGNNNAVYSYDTNTDTWTALTSFPDPTVQFHDNAMAYDLESDRIILFGMGQQIGNNNAAYSYDTNTDTWTALTSFPDPTHEFHDNAMAYLGIAEQSYTGSIWHVSVNGSDIAGNGSELLPFLTIQNAVSMAGSGDTVKLAPGEFLENVIFNHDTLTVMAEAGGVAIVNGNNIESCFIIDSSQVDIFNISFTNGSVQTWPKNGSGIRYNESIGKVKGCKLYENNSTVEGSGAGGIGISYSHVDIDSCDIYENSAADIGGGISYVWASGDVTNTMISGNIAYGADPRGGGGVAIWHSSVSLAHNLIHTNSAARGGGIWIQSISSLDVLNCTITENLASERSGGISQYDWSNNSVSIENSIVWGNDAPANPDYGIGEAEINYSLIQWPSGIGNINSDPMFSEDYTLSYNSPAIDAGHPDLDGDGDSWEIDSDDQDPDGTRMDMGAYYFHQDLGINGALWHVSNGGSDDSGSGSDGNPFATIARALLEVSEGDTIIVAGGTYAITSSLVIPSDSITIISAAGLYQTEILGYNSIPFLDPLVGVGVEVKIEGFTFSNFSVIANDTDYLPTFSFCRFSDNIYSYYSGLFNMNDDAPGSVNMDHCIFVNNMDNHETAEAGIFHSSYVNYNFDYCTFGTNGAGLFNTYAGSVNFNNSIVGISLFGNNSMGRYASYSYIKYPQQYQPGLLNNCIDGSIYSQAGFAGEWERIYRLAPTSICIDAAHPEDMDPDGTRADIGAIYFDQDTSYAGSIWHISEIGDNWIGTGNEESPFSSFLVADIFASPGDTILIHDGTYFSRIVTQTDSITFASLYLMDNDTSHISATIIDGELERQVVQIDQSGVNLIGLTIQNGRMQNYGGGIYIGNAADVSLDRLNILNNSTYGVSHRGGGISSQNSPNLRVSNCLIQGNSSDIGGAIYSGYAGSIVAEGNIIKSNISESFGGALSIESVQGYFSHNTFVENTTNGEGQAIHLGENSSMDMAFNSIYSSSPSNSTISQTSGSNLNIENSILWGATNFQVSVLSAAENCTTAISYSDIKNGLLGLDDPAGILELLWGDGNLNENPAFSNGANLRLTSISPCIDAGNPDYDSDGDSWEIDTDDQDPDGSRLDMGAHYYDQTLGSSGTVWHVSTEGSDEEGDGSISNPFETIQHGINQASQSDTIQIHSGTFRPTSHLTIDKSISFVGYGSPQPTISLDSASIHANLWNDSQIETNFTNLQFTSDGNTSEWAFILNSGSFRFSDCHFYEIHNSYKLRVRNSFLDVTSCDFSNSDQIVDIVSWADGDHNRINFNNNQINQESLWIELRDPTDSLFISDYEFLQKDVRLESGYLNLSDNIFNNCPIKFLVDEGFFESNTFFSCAPASGTTLINIESDGEGTFYRNLFSWNNASSGLIHANDTELFSFDHCTFVSNETSLFSLTGESHGVLSNSLIQTNDSQNILSFNGASDQSFDSYYSLVDFSGGGGWGQADQIEENVIYADPIFVDPENYDYHVQYGSPVIDSGDPNSPLDPDSTRADMGAYYFDQSFPSQVEYSLTYDGIDDYVEIPDDGLLDITNEITLEAWVKINEFTSGHILAKPVPGEHYESFKLGINGSGNYEFRYYVAGAEQVLEATSTPAVANNWTHVAGVYDGSIMKIYINGEISDSLNMSGSGVSIEGSTLIGVDRDPTGLNQYFSGNIDEIRIWNRSRTNHEINSYLNTSIRGLHEGLIASWSCNSGEGLNVDDASGNGLIGSINGAQWSTDSPISVNPDTIPPYVLVNSLEVIDNVKTGDALNVTWSASDNVGLNWAKLFFSSNDGTSFSFYDSVDANLGEIQWIVPDVISNFCKLSIQVSDFAGNVSADTLSESFSIQDGTSPIISIQTPTTTTSIREHDSLHVSWIASDNIGVEQFVVWFSDHPDEPFAYLSEIGTQNTTFSFVIGEGVSDSAQIKMVVLDQAGNMGEDFSDYFSITDNTRPEISHFSIPDTLDWGIGSVIDISVIAIDNVEITGLDLKYTTDNGANWWPIVEALYPVQGRPTYSWLIPDIPGDCQIQAVVKDAVGLMDTSYSDIFSVFIEYPRMIASLSEIRPDGDMHLRFSQRMDSLDIASGTQVVGSVRGVYEIEGTLNGHDLTLSSPDGFVSLDTLQIILTSSAWTNSFGYGLDGNADGVYGGDATDNDTSFTIVTAAGDYDQNGVLNFDDFDDFVIAWNNDVSEYELAPHQGEIPYINIQPDSSFDIFDLATFASMWNWTAGLSLSAPLTESYHYEDFISEQNGNELEVSLPISEFVASQTIIKYDPNVVQILVADDGLAKVSSSGLSMVDVNPDSGFILITSSHLTDSNDDDLNLKLIPDTKQRYTIEIAFQGSDMDANVVQKRSRVELLPIPTSYSLSQNYPNPFNASTTLEYGLPKNSELSISIYDIRGRFVKDIYTGEKQAGYHVTQWNGSNDVGQNVASGLYFIVLHTPEYRVARKALILK